MELYENQSSTIYARWIEEEFAYISFKRYYGVSNVEEEQRIRRELQIPEFNGRNCYDWIREMEDIFRFFQLNEMEKMKVVLMSVVGDARQWVEEEQQRRRSYEWSELKFLLLLRFGGPPTISLQGPKYQNTSLSHSFNESTKVMGQESVQLDNPHMLEAAETKVTDVSLSFDTSGKSGDESGKNVLGGFGGSDSLGSLGGQGDDPINDLDVGVQNELLGQIVGTGCWSGGGPGVSVGGPKKMENSMSSGGQGSKAAYGDKGGGFNGSRCDFVGERQGGFARGYTGRGTIVGGRGRRGHGEKFERGGGCGSGSGGGPGITTGREETRKKKEYGGGATVEADLAGGSEPGGRGGFVAVERRVDGCRSVDEVELESGNGCEVRKLLLVDMCDETLTDSFTRLQEKPILEDTSKGKPVNYPKDDKSIPSREFNQNMQDIKSEVGPTNIQPNPLCPLLNSNYSHNLPTSLAIQRHSSDGLGPLTETIQPLFHFSPYNFQPNNLINSHMAITSPTYSIPIPQTPSLQLKPSPSQSMDDATLFHNQSNPFKKPNHPSNFLTLPYYNMTRKPHSMISSYTLHSQLTVSLVSDKIRSSTNEALERQWNPHNNCESIPFHWCRGRKFLSNYNPP